MQDHHHWVLHAGVREYHTFMRSFGMSLGLAVKALLLMTMRTVVMNLLAGGNCLHTMSFTSK